MPDRTAAKSTGGAGENPETSASTGKTSGKGPTGSSAGKAAAGAKPAKPANLAKPAKPPKKTSSKASMTTRAKSTIKRAADEHSANARATSQGGTASPDQASGTARRPTKKSARRARLRLTRVDPWSVMKTSFLLSIAFAIVLVVSVFMVWSVLSAAGVWQSINSTVESVLGGESASSFDIEDYVGTSRVLGFTLLVAALDVILLTAIATLGAFLYNMAAALLGGIEVTLAEDIH